MSKAIESTFDVEAVGGKIFRHYEGMLRAVLPADEDSKERTRYEEYFANMMEDLETEEDLVSFVKGLVDFYRPTADEV